MTKKVEHMVDVRNWHDIDEPKEVKQKDGTVMKVDMKVRLANSPCNPRYVETVQTYGLVKRIVAQERKVCWSKTVEKRVLIDILITQVVYVYRWWDEANRRMRDLGKIFRNTWLDSWTPDNRSDILDGMIGYKVSFEGDEIYLGDGIYGELVAHNDGKFVWVVKMKKNVLGMIKWTKNGYQFISKDGRYLEKEALVNISEFLERAESRFRVVKMVTCSICKETGRPNLDGQRKLCPDVCVDCCDKFTCEECKKIRKVFKK